MTFIDRCSTHTFPIVCNDDDWVSLNREFVAFLEWKDRVIDFSQLKTFVCLTKICNGKVLKAVLDGVDCVELRMDMIMEGNSIEKDPFDAFYANLRRVLDGKPVVFTVRSVKHGGLFKGSKGEFWELVREYYFRLRMDVLDVEEEMFDATEISRFHVSNVILSSHDASQSSASWIQSKIESLEVLAGSLKGKGILVKVVGYAKDFAPCLDYFEAVAKFRSRSKYQTLVLLMGDQGKLTRILAPYMTPVTHELLAVAAPGQFTLDTLMRLRREMGLIRSGTFYLIGYPIALSPSPMIHNRYFQQYRLPFTYKRFECQAGAEASLKTLLKEDIDFLGASVTIPHKETVIPYLDEMDEAASRIGSVNTVIKRSDRLIGYNTDYQGILKSLEEHEWDLTGDVLVVGAGGTARAALYAVNLMLADKPCFILNRDVGKALGISHLKANCSVMRWEANLEIPKSVTLVIITVPSQVTVPLFLNDESGQKRLILDLAYETESLDEEDLGKISFRPNCREILAKAMNWQYVHGYRVLEWQAVFQRRIFKVYQ